jgi:hypothetical protein
MKCATTVLLSVLATCPLAQAAGASEADPKTVEQATRLLRDAKADYSAGRYEQSRAKLDEACSLVHTANCVHNLAMAELKTGRHLDAYRHFREAFSEPSATWLRSEEIVSETRKMMDEAYAALGHIAIRAPDGANVAIDGQAMGTSREPVDVQPGSHLVEVRLGAQIGRERVDAKAGSVETVTLRLESPPAPFPVVTEPAPAAGSPRPEDRAMATEHASWWTTRRTVGAAVVGAGAASLVLNLVFASQALNASNPSTHNHYARLTYITLGAGILGVAGGALLILWPESGPKTAVAPVLSTSSAGLLFRREF